MNRIVPFLLVAFVLSQAAFAQGAPEHPEPGHQLMYDGKLTDIDRGARSFTVETPSGPETFTLIEGGTVLGAGAETGFQALAVGQQVAVEAIQNETNQRLVRSVQIVASPTGGR